MQDTTDIKHLSRAEKLRVMEAIWEDLSKDDDQLESPQWHQKALQQTEERLEKGQEDTVDWSDAKRTLRDRFE